MRKWFAISVLLLSACGTSSSSNTAQPPSTDVSQTAVATPTPGKAEDEENTTPVTDSLKIDLNAIPPVDTSEHSVPLEDIYFDTFRATNRAVPLSVAGEDLIRSLLDAIPPIYHPVFESAAQADTWLQADDIVLGYADGEEAFAYPVRILNFHEIVSHDVNGRPIAATYCPLCRSGVVYDRRLNGEELLFGNTSALYESDMVMVDHQTGSYWVQVSGEAVVGPLTGERLTPLPSQMTTWSQWKEQYPSTVSLSQDTGYRRNYDRDPFAGYPEQLNATGRFAFPVTDAVRDPRLDPGDIVLGVQAGGETAVYPLAQIGDGVVNDVVGETAVVIFSRSNGPAGAAYLATVDDQTLTFAGQDGEIKDEETGSTWNFAGEAVAGQLTGTQLDPLPVRSTLWFAMIAAFPEAQLYSP